VNPRHGLDLRARLELFALEDLHRLLGERAEIGNLTVLAIDEEFSLDYEKERQLSRITSGFVALDCSKFAGQMFTEKLFARLSSALLACENRISFWCERRRTRSRSCAMLLTIVSQILGLIGKSH
jgi:hypothetical protein